MHRRLYATANGMGGISFTGLTPEAVAKLTFWQVEHDYFGLAKEIQSEIEANRGNPRASLEDDGECPARETHIAFMRKQQPEWSVDELNAHYDQFKANWEEGEEIERKERGAKGK